MSGRRIPYLILLLLPGCVPGVTWLPDSGGFFFTDGDDFEQLVFFDKATATTRVVVKDTGAPTFWPAVSPDGKTIAVAKHAWKRDEPGTMQMAFFNCQGQEIKRTKRFPWPKVHRREFTQDSLPFLVWSPWGDKIFVHSISDSCGILDVPKERLNILDGTPMLIGHSPLRPDGKGFLLLGKNNLLSVDWEGKKSLIKGMEEIEKNHQGNWAALFGIPHLVDSWWEGPNAFSRLRTERLFFNLHNHTVTLQKVDPNRGPKGQLIHKQFEFPRTKVHIRLLELEAEEALPLNPVRLEISLPKAKQAQVFLAKTRFCMLVPSPNKSAVAVCCYSGDERFGFDHLFVIDQEGKVLLHHRPAKKKRRE